MIASSNSTTSALNPHLYRWIRKLASDGLKPGLLIIEWADEFRWAERERFWIAELKRLGGLCNVTEGGNQPPSSKGRKLTDEQKKNISLNWKGGMTGKRHSEETKLKMSLARRGRKQSIETIAKRSAALLGRKISPETRAKMSAAHVGKKHSPAHIAKAALGHRGLKASSETRRKMSVAQRLAWARRKAA